MAVQIEPPGQLQEFLDILRRRKWQVILPALLILSMGIAFAVVVPKKYKVTTQIELRTLLLGDASGRSAKEATKGVAENAPQQIMSMKRITEVIEDLKWPDYLTLTREDRNEYRRRIRNNISVNVPRQAESGSAFVNITYLDVNKERAQQFLKALRGAWIEQVVERDRTRIDSEYDTLLDRRADLDKEWLKQSRLLSDGRIDNNISPTQPTPGKHEQRFEDPTVERYTENLNRLDELEIELEVAQIDLELRIAQLAETLPEVPRTSLLKGISYEEQIETLEKKAENLEQELQGIRPAHSRWRKTMRDLEDVYQEIRELENSQTEGAISQEFEPNQAYIELEQTIADLETLVARGKAERQTLRDVVAEDREEIAQLAKAYREDTEHATRIEILIETLGEVASALQVKKQQREVIFGPAGNPFQIIEEVEPPSSPSEPDPILLLVFSVVLGLAAGLGSALVSEFSTNSFRTTSDITRVMVVPVLGVISPIVTRIQRRRRRLRRFAVGGACLVLDAVILLATWAWAYEPDLLSDGMVDSIEGFRSLFL